MSRPRSSRPQPYIAVIRPVREVILAGSADLGFWRDHLRDQRLVPYEHNGAAELQISATALRWLGVGFRELTVGVAVASAADPSARAGLYLVQAFSSSRAFALAERRLFQTPYRHATLHVEERVPARVALHDGGRRVLQAAMAATRSSSGSAADDWQGPIFLPRAAGAASDPGQLFFARLSGQRIRYPFVASDTLELRPEPRDRWLRWLDESRFTAQEWRLCADATHARSRTYRRD